jgi:hypothetical protein
MQLAQVQEEQELKKHEIRLMRARIGELEEEVRLRAVREEDLLQRVGEGEMELAVAMKTMSSLATKVRVDKNVVRGGKVADSSLLWGREESTSCSGGRRRTSCEGFRELWIVTFNGLVKLTPRTPHVEGHPR